MPRIPGFGRKKGEKNSEKLLDLNKIWAIVIKNWIVLKGDKTRLIPMMMFPLLMLIVFGYTAGNLPKYIPAAVVDYDNSGMSHAFIGQIYSNQLFSIEREVGSREEGKKLIDAGAVKVLFIIPSGFEKAILSNQPTTLSVIADESDPSIAQIVKASTQAFVAQVSNGLTAQRLLQISQQSKAEAQKLESISGSLGAVNMVPIDTESSAISSAYQSTQKTILQSNAALQTSGQTLQNSLGPLLNPAGAFGPNTADVRGLVFVDRTLPHQQAILDQLAAAQGAMAANQQLLTNAGQMSLAGQLLVAQSNQLKAQINLSISSLQQAKEELNTISADAQDATIAPLNLNQVDPYGSGRRGIDFLLPSILALIIFQGASAGLGRAIAGERHDGSLTRVFLTPTSNFTIISGTQLFYMLFETLRSSLIIFIAIALFGVTISGSILDIIAVIALFAFGATGVGMVLSVLTRSQEQYMALSMLISFPILFLSGVFIPIQTMPAFFQGITEVLPITYAADALRGIMVKGFGLLQLLPDLGYLLLFGVFIFLLTLALFKRELV